MASPSPTTPANASHIDTLEGDLLANYALREALTSRAHARPDEWEAWDKSLCAILKQIEDLDASDPAARRLKALAIMTIYGTDPEILGDGTTTDMRLARQIVRALGQPWPITTPVSDADSRGAPEGAEVLSGRQPALA